MSNHSEITVKSEITLSTRRAYIILFTLIAASSIVSVLIYSLVWISKTTSIEGTITIADFIIFFLITGLLFILHEFFHAVGFKLFGKVPWREIKIGILWKSLTPYTHCHVPIAVRRYRLVGLLPNIILGFIPTIIGLLTKNSYIYFMGVFMGIGGLGDFLIIWLIRKLPSNTYVIDHPSKLGCQVLQ